MTDNTTSEVRETTWLVTFYITDSEVRETTPDDTGFWAYTVRVDEFTTLGDVLQGLLGGTGDGFEYGFFVAEEVTEDTVSDTTIEGSYFFGRLSDQGHFDEEHRTSLLVTLIERYSKYVVICGVNADVATRNQNAG